MLGVGTAGGSMTVVVVDSWRSRATRLEDLISMSTLSTISLSDQTCTLDLREIEYCHVDETAGFRDGKLPFR